MEWHPTILAVVSAAIGAVVGLVVFRGRLVPLAGDNSLTTWASLLIAIAGSAVFIWQYIASISSTARWKRRHLVRRILEVAGLTLASVGISVLALVAACSVIHRAFVGMSLNALAAAALLAVATGVATSVLRALADNMTTSRLARLLGLFLAAGVLAGMLTTDDPSWWLSNFSALGLSTTSSARTFNVTMILAGLVLTTLADYLTADLEQVPAVSARRVTVVRMVLVLIGLGLMGVGFVPVDVSQLFHNICSIGALVGFGVIVLAAPWLLRGLPQPFLAASGAVCVAMVAIVLLWVPIGFYNLTAVELLAVLLLFGWLSLFANAIGQKVAVSPPAAPREALPVMTSTAEDSDIPRGKTASLAGGPRSAPGTVNPGATRRGVGSAVLVAALLGAVAGSLFTGLAVGRRR